MNSILIKVGGSVLHDDALIASLCADIKLISAAGYKIILVHGGSKAINAALKTEGISSAFIDGLRVTSSAAMKLIEKVLIEQVNPSLVTQLNDLGVPAIGISGAKDNLLQCEYYSPQHDFVGAITSVNTQHLQQLMSHQPIPVIATIGVDKAGNSLNINADMAACCIANALKVDQMIYLTDQDGIYDGQGKVLPYLYEDNLHTLIHQSLVTDGMLVKVKAILASLKAGLNNILILNGTQKQALRNAVFNFEKSGTLCVQNTNYAQQPIPKTGVYYDTHY